MKQDDWHQRDFNRQSGQEEHYDPARKPFGIRLVTDCEEVFCPFCIMQRNDHGYRRKAHLKAGSNKAFGPEHQDKKRRRRDHSKRQRLSPDCQSDKHQHRGKARAHRGDLRACQQRIAHPASSRKDCCRQREPDAQNQPRPKGKQFNRYKISASNHRADVQPADREQMGQSRIAHHRCIARAYGAPVAACKCRSDCTRSPLKTGLNMGRYPPLRRCKRARIAAPFDQFNLAQC